MAIVERETQTYTTQTLDISQSTDLATDRPLAPPGSDYLNFGDSARSLTRPITQPNPQEIISTRKRQSKTNPASVEEMLAFADRRAHRDIQILDWTTQQVKDPDSQSDSEIPQTQLDLDNIMRFVNGEMDSEERVLFISKPSRNK